MSDWETDDEKSPVRGPVETLATSLEARVYVRGEWIEERVAGADVAWRFDEAGRIVEAPSLGFICGGCLDCPTRYTYSYDASGRREGCEGFNDYDSHVERVDIAYPPEGGAIRSVYKTGPRIMEPRLKSRSWLDAAGRLVESRTYEQDGTLSYLVLAHTEREGATLVEKGYAFGEYRENRVDLERPYSTIEDPAFGDGILWHMLERSFDAEGRQVEQRLYEQDGRLQTRTVFVFGAEGLEARYEYYSPYARNLCSSVKIEYWNRRGDQTECFVLDGDIEVVLLGDDGRDVALEEHPASAEWARGMRVSLVADGRRHEHEYRRGERGLLERVAHRVTDPSGVATEEATSDRGGPLNYHHRFRYLAYDAFGNWTRVEDDFRNAGYWSRCARERTLTYFT